MGRGEHETTKIKREIKLTAKTAAAIEAAKQKIDRKNFNKNFPYEIKKALIETIKKIEPLELASTLITTYVIHGIILSTAELFERAENIAKGLDIISSKPEAINIINPTSNPLGLITNWISNIPFLIAALIEGVDQDTAEKLTEGLTKIAEKPESDSLYIWALSYAIAYYIQKHGITDVFGAIKGFLGFTT